MVQLLATFFNASYKKNKKLKFRVFKTGLKMQHIHNIYSNKIIIHEL